MPTSTTHRVAENTAECVNEQIRLRTQENIARYSRSVADINRRLAELDQEWDIERTVETNFAGVVVFGCGMSAVSSRAWLLLPLVAAGFMFQHTLQGWCPPVPVLRRLGFRTQAEIDEEKYALKALRGDFVGTAVTRGRANASKVEKALQAATA